MACRTARALALFLLPVAISQLGCSGPAPVDPDSGPTPREDAGRPTVRCTAADDPDMDFISTMDEGTGDADGDGIPNHQDTDSDGDGFSDADEAGDSDCNSPPVDTDGDGTPDFLDRDANGDGIDDEEQAETDTDGDGTPDYRDTDVDGDGIPNDIEWGDGETARDSDGDGTPDVFDRDSDGDTVDDIHEGIVDVDGDGLPNYLDDDSDGDGIPDAVEAGDGDLSTPPAVCPEEINPVTGTREADGRADFVDSDSDNDGLGDGEEIEIGTDPCNTDSDGDGLDDLAEGAYERYNCPDGETGTDCGCATQAGCTIPDEHFYVVLPYMGPPVERDLEFGTSIRVADVFFLTDTTGSMSGTLTRVKTTVATPGTGLIDRIRETIPDAWFGGGQHDDFPFGSYGSSPDEPFILAIRMTPPEMSAAVQTAFNGIMIHNGADGPESQSEAIYQVLTGLGNTWMYAGGGFGGAGTYTIRRYVGDCLDSGWGAPCFRDAALPIIVLFTDICSHNGPPGEDSSCDPYTGITPAPVEWTDMIAEMNRRGAKFVGVNASGGAGCASVVGPSGFSPCYFLRRTAEESGSIDLDGNALVYDLPNTGTSDTVFADTVVGAIETVATRVPLDIDTGLRDDPTDPAPGVDATRFIKRRQPACRATPPAATCWTPPEGLAHEDAVAYVDESTFFGVIPGTLVTFRITFQNDFHMGGTTAQVFIAFIDVRTGTAILDTRQVIIVVPANDSIFG